MLEGDINQATEVVIKGWELCQEVGLKHLLPYILCLKSEILQIQGKHDQVIQEIDQVIHEAIKTEDLRVQGVACRITGVRAPALSQVA